MIKIIVSFICVCVIIGIANSSPRPRRYLKIVDSYERIKRSVQGSDRERAELLQRHIEMLKRCSTTEPKGPDTKENIRKLLFCNATVCPGPVAIFLGGGSASGKSEVTSRWEHLYNKSCGIVHIDPDAIMMELPEWDQIRNSSRSNCTANTLYSKAGALAQQFYDDALNLGVNIVYDGTMGKLNRTLSQIHKAKQRKYQLRMVGSNVNTSVSAVRSLERGHKIGRYVPLCALIDTHAKYSKYFSIYAELIPRHQLFESTNKSGVMMEKDSHIRSWPLFTNFLAQAHHTVASVEKEMPQDVVDEYERLNKECDFCKVDHDFAGYTKS